MSQGRAPASRPGNLGATSLRRKARSADPMREFDKLPSELRAWLVAAALPWRPQSVRRAFDKAYARTRETQSALRELDRLERRLLAKDAPRVWGARHPLADRADAAEPYV